MKKLCIAVVLLLLTIDAHGANNDSFDSFVDQFFREPTESTILFPFTFEYIIDNPDWTGDPFISEEREYGKESIEDILKLVLGYHDSAVELGAVKSIELISDSGYRLKFSGPDSGFLIYYYFCKFDDRWLLYKIENSST